MLHCTKTRAGKDFFSKSKSKLMLFFFFFLKFCWERLICLCLCDNRLVHATATGAERDRKLFQSQLQSIISYLNQIYFPNANDDIEICHSVKSSFNILNAAERVLKDVPPPLKKPFLNTVSHLEMSLWEIPLIWPLENIRGHSDISIYQSSKERYSSCLSAPEQHGAARKTRGLRQEGNLRPYLRWDGRHRQRWTLGFHIWPRLSQSVLLALLFWVFV